jgi:hypothetical protein
MESESLMIPYQLLMKTVRRLWWRTPSPLRGILLIAFCAIPSFTIGYSTLLRGMTTIALLGAVTLLFILAEHIHNPTER